jgi:ribosomal 30S subunit maturation factor RimM
MELGVEEFDRRMVDMGKVGKRVGWLAGWVGLATMTDKEEEGGKGVRA